jgi:hypothetical protein
MSTLLEIGLEEASYATFVHHIDGRRKLVTLAEVPAILKSPLPDGQSVHKVNLLLSYTMVKAYLALASKKSGLKRSDQECIAIAVAFLAQDMQKIGLPMYGDPVPTKTEGWSCLLEQDAQAIANAEVDSAIDEFLASAK